MEDTLHTNIEVLDRIRAASVSKNMRAGVMFHVNGAEGHQGLTVINGWIIGELAYKYRLTNAGWLQRLTLKSHTNTDC